ncbi:hypothetical protein DFH27DRAFT_213386 [Peziza echinospora]|nr:hypothetical protein DFH27DRAFT_213386 [Peziza echinospora]
MHTYLTPRLASYFTLSSVMLLLVVVRHWTGYGQVDVHASYIQQSTACNRHAYEVRTQNRWWWWWWPSLLAGRNPEEFHNSYIPSLPPLSWFGLVWFLRVHETLKRLRIR